MREVRDEGESGYDLIGLIGPLSHYHERFHFYLE